MATRKSQRIGILVIAAVMVVGTIGSFAVLVLANENQRKQQEETNKLFEEYKKQLEEKEKKAQGLIDTYAAEFKTYNNRPAPFDAAAVGDSVTTIDLKTGEGQTLEEGTTYRAFYIGWLPDGTVFDSSIEGDSLKQPFDTSVLGTIPGWQQGVLGMKVGGVRELTIPAELAYGEEGKDPIPPSTPIKFVVLIAEADKAEG